MKNARDVQSARNTGERPLALNRMTYQNLAGGLAFEMAEHVRTTEPRKFCAPFKLVIVDPQGAVVFSCEVDKDWKVLHQGPSRVVRRSHFPATALLTDSSLVTRTFQIDRACG